MPICYISEVEPRICLKETNNHSYHTCLSNPDAILDFLKEYMEDLTTECILVSFCVILSFSFSFRIIC